MLTPRTEVTQIRDPCVGTLAVVPNVPSWLARLWIVGGVVGAVASLVASVFAWTVLGSLAETSVESIEVAAQVVESVGGSVAAVDSALDEVTDGLRTTQQSVADASVTLTQLSALASNLSDLVGEDVPASLDSVRAAIAPIEASAGVLDGTLRALSFFGVDYEPEVPLDEAIDDLDARLSEIPETLRLQAPIIDSAADSLNDFGGDTLDIAQDLSDLRGRLAQAGGAVGGYRTTIDQANAVLADVEVNIASRIGPLRVVIVLLALGLATTQTIPIALGWWYLSSQSSNTVKADRDGG